MGEGGTIWAFAVGSFPDVYDLEPVGTKLGHQPGTVVVSIPVGGTWRRDFDFSGCRLCTAMEMVSGVREACGGIGRRLRRGVDAPRGDL